MEHPFCAEIHSSLSSQYYKGIASMHKNYKIKCYTEGLRQCTKARKRQKKGMSVFIENAK